MHRFRAVVAAFALIAAGIVVAAPGSSHAASDHLAVGRLTLHRCQLGLGPRPTYCGSLKAPLNYRSSNDGLITVGFGWVPARHPVPGVPPPTIVAEEGGPGYPSTGTATDYAAMLGPRLLDADNLLLVDERGTGRSTPIDCRSMENLHITTTTRAFEQSVHACGASLNHRFPRTGGGYVHASDLFTTANGVRDLARVMSALGTGKVDLYGDSYGTYFAQSFLSHFPHRLRSVTLDSAYEARDLDPWYGTTLTTAHRAFDAACTRSAACAHDAGSSSWTQIGALARLLRRHPIAGSAPGVDAKRVTVELTVTSLVNIVNDAGYDYDPYRQLDAAVRAYLDHRDAAPLLRLYAQDIGYDYSDYNAAASYYSDGQYFAVGCTDYPQLFNMHASPKRRRAQFAAAVHHHAARAFAPFTVAEWVSMNPFTETFHACTSWPSDTHRRDPPVLPHHSMDAAHVPVLILNGEFDSLTPAAGGAHIHRQIGAASRHIVTANTVHLVGLDDHYGCGERLVRRFITAPEQLHSMSDSCASTVPTVRTVGNFPRTVRAATPTHGTGSRLLRQRVAVAIEAAGDAAIRYNYVDGNRDLGLRGGSVRYTPRPGSAFAAHLHSVRWTLDSSVSGLVVFTPNALTASGTVTITGTHAKPLRIRLRWAGTEARAAAAGHTLSAPAP